jgi:Ni/Co efflux regulator RcnB
MRKLVLTLAATAAVVAPLAVSGGAANAVTPKHYANCTAMHKVYKHGVAKSSAASRHDGHGALVAPRVYALNTGSDRDHDGVACEA